MRDINEYLDAKTVIIIVLAILIVILAVLCLRQWGNMSDLSEMIEEESLKNLSYQSEIVKLRKEKDDIAENGREEEIYKKMPLAPDEAELITGINTLCKDTFGILRDITFLSRKEQGTYIEMPFTITLISNYYSLVQFLEGIGMSERFIQLTGLDITVDEESDLLNVTISASAFSYSQ